MHGIILKSQFCGVVSFFEYGRIEKQATMEGKTLLNKNWALSATIFKSTEFVEEKEIQYATLKFRVQFKISWGFDEFKKMSRDWAEEGKAWKPKGNLCIQSLAAYIAICNWPFFEHWAELRTWIRNWSSLNSF